jgi:hypothetical protein
MPLSDIQTILLISAAGRDNGSLLPLPASLKPSGGTTKALISLVRKGFAEERVTDTPAMAYRHEDDVSFGAFITLAGGAAVALDPDQLASGPLQVAPAPAPAPVLKTAPKAPTKIAVLISLMERPAGATLVDLTAATGWLPHTARAALTGIRKKGRNIIRGKREGVTCYTLQAQGGCA